MIFLIDHSNGKQNVVVYDNLIQLSQMVEWQDILDVSCIILDEEGKLYAWDDSKKEEIGTIYDYTFKMIGTNEDLLQRCKLAFEKPGRVDEFELEN